MIVTFWHTTEQTGMLTKTTHYCVTVQVQFSQEESFIINKVGLGPVVVLKREPSTFAPGAAGLDAEIHYLRISHLAPGNKHGFMTPLDARDYVAELKEALTKLKPFILGNSDIWADEATETIEI